MKWGRLDDKGQGFDRASLELDRPDLWQAMIAKWDLAGSTKWAIASVNPPREEALARVIAEARPLETTWYRTARDVFPDLAVHVPVNAGVDRAMLVLAARARVPLGSPALVISCGTAITVERLDRAGRWEGGVIAAGLGMTSRALNHQTALLPFVAPQGTPPRAWGGSTATSMEAGIFWGTVGSVREILTRQEEGCGNPLHLRIWTGGDAHRLAPHVDGPYARIIPDLVLVGVAIAAFSCDPEAEAR